MQIEYIPCVNAVDFPEEVQNWCIEREISTHYQNDIVYIEDDGNPFAEWLKKNNIIKNKNDYWFIGIIAT